MLTLIHRETFISDGLAKKINLPGSATFMKTFNHTQWATQQTPGRLVAANWDISMADGTGLGEFKEDGEDTIEYRQITSGGFTYVTKFPQPETEQIGTAVTDANPAVVTINSHGYSNGDRIRIYGSTGMLQIAGMDFTIGSVATNTFELSFLDASGFAAAATAVRARRIPKSDVINPSVRFITNISQATQAVVKFSVTHEYVVDQQIQINVPLGFGMVEANGLVGRVVSVDEANNTVTLDIDSSAFTAFSFPASGAVPVSFPHAAPEGQNASYNMEVSYRSGLFIPFMHLGSGAQGPAGSNGDRIVVEAYRSE